MHAYTMALRSGDAVLCSIVLCGMMATYGCKQQLSRLSIELLALGGISVASCLVITERRSFLNPSCPLPRATWLRAPVLGTRSTSAHDSTRIGLELGPHRLGTGSHIVVDMTDQSVALSRLGEQKCRHDN